MAVMLRCTAQRITCHLHAADPVRGTIPNPCPLSRSAPHQVSLCLFQVLCLFLLGVQPGARIHQAPALEMVRVGCRARGTPESALLLVPPGCIAAGSLCLIPAATLYVSQNVADKALVARHLLFKGSSTSLHSKH